MSNCYRFTVFLQQMTLSAPDAPATGAGTAAGGDEGKVFLVAYTHCV